MENIKKNLDDNIFFDCCIKCICNDKIEYVNAHMAVLSVNSYFNKLFEWTESKPLKEEKRYINGYDIQIDFTSISLLTCVELLYNKIKLSACEDIDDVVKHINDPGDLLNALVFFDFDNEYIQIIMSLIITKIIDSSNYEEIKCIINQIGDNELDKNVKCNFIGRTLCLLKEEDKKEFIDTHPLYIPQHIFSNIIALTDKTLTLCGNFDQNAEFIYMNLKFTAYTSINQNTYDDTGFWITASPIENSNIESTIELPLKTTVCLNVYDGIKTKHRIIRQSFWKQDDDQVTFPPEFNDLHEKLINGQRKRYGDIIYQIFDDTMAFEFIILFE